MTRYRSSPLQSLCLKDDGLKNTKGIVHPKNVSFIHPHFIQNLYEFISSVKHKIRYFESQYFCVQTVEVNVWLPTFFIMSILFFRIKSGMTSRSKWFLFFRWTISLNLKDWIKYYQMSAFAPGLSSQTVAGPARFMNINYVMWWWP